MLFAWTALALGSALPGILWRQLTGEAPSAWIPGAQAVALAALLPSLARRRSWRPLRGFVLALAAMQFGLLIVTLLREIPSYAEWAGRAPRYETVFVSAFFQLIPGVLMLLTAVANGLGRRELFLERGDVAARSRLPGTRRRISWRRLGPLLVGVLTVPLAVQLAFANDPDFDRLGKAVALLPLALVFGAVNALNEELRFRARARARRHRRRAPGRKD